MIHHGDCLDVMAGMEPESVDAIVTDPPYLLRFMGKSWDGPTQMSGHATPDAATVGFYQAVGKGGRHDGGMDNWKPNWMQSWHQRWAEAAYRVAKPSAYLLAFGGTRTVHRMAVAIEDAGWIIRDMLVWAYASGFPKSKASLKPAWEPIVMARKPGPLRMLAIDACRIPSEGETIPRVTGSGIVVGGKTEGGYDRPWKHDDAAVARRQERADAAVEAANTLGRWPANVILTATEDGRAIFDGGVDGVVGGGETSIAPPYRITDAHASVAAFPVSGNGATYGDSGTYSRFFLVPKASRSDREPVLTPDWFEGTGRVSTHPTVKPTELMRHLVRLVTPAGGTVLDPFLGSGSTGLACELEGFPWIGIEKEAEYVAIAEARLNGTQRGLGLVG